uniref:ornithine decarboxylase n=1 Tax=Salarias fasciatus TaxID=181472 RepID=A0A672HSL2_SALFA
KAYLRWTTNLPRVQPFYAVKCNNTPAVLWLLSALGSGFDCASKGEIDLALSLGVTPDKIIYAHPTKPSYHIRYACSQGVDTMTFDNEEELLKISSFHAHAKLVLRIAVDDSKSELKLSPKFGVPLSSAGKLLERAAQLGLQVTGVSFHVGSRCTESSAFKQAIADSRHVFDIAMSLLDIGGGFSGTDDSVSFDEFSEVINEALDELFPPDSGVRIIAEPGRYCVESAFTLAVNVIAKRAAVNETDGSSGKYLLLTSRMEYYINDGVYGSLNCILNFPENMKIEPHLHRPRLKSLLWGPTCDCVDKVLDSVWIPELRVGDWLLLDNSGAYTSSLCSDFNGFERALTFPVMTADAFNTLIRPHCTATFQTSCYSSEEKTCVSSCSVWSSNTKSTSKCV